MQSVTPTWSVNGGAASISQAGVLTTGTVSGDTTVTVSATYPLNGTPPEHRA
jgi:hypothetical protein